MNKRQCARRIDDAFLLPLTERAANRLSLNPFYGLNRFVPANPL